MYIDPSLGGLLLEPLFQLEFEITPLYAIPDLGVSQNWRFEALIIEDLKGRITPMSHSAIHKILVKESSVCISLAGLAYH